MASNEGYFMMTRYRVFLPFFQDCQANTAFVHDKARLLIGNGLIQVIFRF